MKKLFSLLLAVCFILSLTACNTPDTPEDTSQSTSASETTDTSTESGKTNEEKGYTFTAKVSEVHEKTILVKTDDEKMLTSSDQFYVSLPETVSAEDFAVGDTVEIELATIYRIEETYPARLPDVVNIRHVVRKTTALEIDVIVTAINEDSYTVMGMTEGYEREFLIMKEDREWEIGNEFHIVSSFRGSYTDTHPTAIENITFMVRNNPDPILFKARIAFSSGHGFYVKGFDDENGRETFTGYIYFPDEIDLTDYEDGDYVEIGYDGWAMETYPLQANALSIRHLTEEEIEEILIDMKTYTLTLQYMGHDEYELIGIASAAYSMDPKLLENIPEMNFKDYFTVVYDGTKCSFFAYTTHLPFVEEIYRSDSRGNRID
ncbi:MAG: hypothetical protein IJ489_11365 [Clostridia bacterium]|nr:hypothetical protein [Clostridia bacterium]